MSKKTLMFVGVVLAIMGLLGLLPDGTLPEAISGTEPVWHAVAKVVVGLVSVGVALNDK